jgi:putative RNA 2'-phosphotransferase
MSRQYVHLSDDLETAKSVASRRRADTVILKVDVNSMLLDGHEFFRSENGVWLARAVDAKYISREL